LASILNAIVRPVCILNMDMEKMPRTKRSGPMGTYYEVSYEIQLNFGVHLVKFACLVEGKVVASAELVYS
jgi:hypothetical protein